MGFLVSLSDISEDTEKTNINCSKVDQIDSPYTQTWTITIKLRDNISKVLGRTVHPYALKFHRKVT